MVLGLSELPSKSLKSRVVLDKDALDQPYSLQQVMKAANIHARFYDALCWCEQGHVQVTVSRVPLNQSVHIRVFIGT